jgi:hypothetical protein
MNILQTSKICKYLITGKLVIPTPGGVGVVIRHSSVIRTIKSPLTRRGPLTVHLGWKLYEVAFRGFCTRRFGVAIPVPTPVEQEKPGAHGRLGAIGPNGATAGAGVPEGIES